MWTIALAAAATAHVPVYPAGTAYTVDRNANISQVIYAPTALLQVTVPRAQFPDDNKLNIDLIIREKADMSKMRFRAECGDKVFYNLHANDTNVVTPTGFAFEAQEGKLEAFTQTSYFSILPGGDDEDGHYHGPEIELTQCTGDTSDLVLFLAHEPDDELNPAAIVIGIEETFTFGELMSFGHYALMNHGYYWNQAGWTYWSLLAIVGFVVIVSLYVAAYYDARAQLAFDDKLREIFYWVAIVGFGAAILEGIVHTGIAQMDIPVDGELAIALVIVILPNLFAMGLIFVNMYLQSDKIQTPVWAPLEIATAFSMFLLFAAGFYIGPSFWLAAGLVRLWRLVGRDSSLYM